MIRYVNLALENLSDEESLLRSVIDVLRSGRLILGSAVETFEKEFAQLHGSPWAVGVASGTDALMFALRSIGAGLGDEVITVPNSFVATVAAICHVGAKPVLVDVERRHNMDPEQLATAITPRTRAIVPVHLFGRPADMPRIFRVAERAGIPIIEDCAQAVVARYAGRPVGSFGRLGCFSLHPLKNLGAWGDAGIIVGGSDADLHTVRLLRNHGLADRDTCVRWGFNSRLDTIHAAVLLVKLKQLHARTERRREIARTYLLELAELPLVLPCPSDEEECVWSAFTIEVEDRDALRTSLDKAGVETLIYYPTPIHLQPAASGLGYGVGSFPVCEALARRILSLPIHPDLTDAQVEAVVRAVKKHYHG